MSIDWNVKLKKGMKVKLAKREYSDYKAQAAKAGDIVKITSVTSVFRGQGSDGFGSDYEMIRVSNGKFSWRIDRGSLDLV